MFVSAWLKIAIIGILGKENNFMLHYAAMFNEQMIELPFHTEEFGASFSCVE